MSDDMSTIITTWLPTIVSFAMLSMVLGMVKGFGRGNK